MIRTFYFLLLSVFFSHGAFSQEATAPLVVMNLAAHPDDEDGSTLAYYRHAKNAIAYSVIYTRGEGGQNEIGPELYEELGAIRTVETERAARHLGTQVFFLNYKDFGFSKSADETFERWGGRDEVTEHIVYLIRKLKPDILFTNHDTVTVGQNRQHGHHQAVGLTAYDAFDLASDPDYHPEQLTEIGVDLWQPKRMFRRLWSSDGEHQVAVPVGDVDTQAGLSYAEMAGRALHEHSSQGMEMFAGRIGEWKQTYFVLYRSATDAPLSGTDLSANLPPNRDAEPHISYWIDSGRLGYLPPNTITAADSIGIPGKTVRVNWTPANLPQKPVRLRFFGAVDTSIVVRDDSAPYANLRIRKNFVPTVPKKVFQYEHFTNHLPIGFALSNPRESGLLAGGYLNLEIAPPIYLEADSEVIRLRGGKNSVSYSVRIFDPSIQDVMLSAALSRDEDRRIVDQHQETIDGGFAGSTSLSLPADPVPGNYTIALSALGITADGALASSKASDFVRGRIFHVRVPEKLRVGVVESYDNTLDLALTDLGIEHVMLDSADLAAGRFNGLHTIVVDIRAYLVREDLKRHNDRLLDWVRRGGHLIVNYHKTIEWNTSSSGPFSPSRPNTQQFAPFPLELGRERVTREDAPVTLLDPEHVLFQRPNRIQPEDWEGWVQERGLYFPSEYDDRYVELLSLHDPGEPPLTSSTLLAHVGGGTYLYSALVWYRQLKDYHPGAYNIFANMLSLPLVDGRLAGP